MKSFINYSEKIGKNFLLCQGPGGNTSIKTEKKILIKKSGSLLSHSSKKNIFKEVGLTNITRHYKDSNIKTNKFDKDLSIEAPLHVMLNSKYVLHYHSIASIIVSSIFKKKKINSILFRNNILPIDYIRPGIELAEEVIKLNSKHYFKSFFLHNHGIIIEGNNIKTLYNKIFYIENIFSKLIDYQKLKLSSKEIIKLNQVNKKVKNPNPEIKYERFNGKYLFPDHSVFFPNFFHKGNDGKNIIPYDNKYFYFNKELSETELTYFKTLLTIYTMINKNKIVNYIDKDVGIKLRNSEDEKLRIDISK